MHQKASLTISNIHLFTFTGVKSTRAQTTYRTGKRKEVSASKTILYSFTFSSKTLDCWKNNENAISSCVKHTHTPRSPKSVRSRDTHQSPRSWPFVVRVEFNFSTQLWLIRRMAKASRKRFVLQERGICSGRERL